jgi:hypothetical protein
MTGNVQWLPPASNVGFFLFDELRLSFAGCGTGNVPVLLLHRAHHASYEDQHHDGRCGSYQPGQDTHAILLSSHRPNPRRRPQFLLGKILCPENESSLGA